MSKCILKSYRSILEFSVTIRPTTYDLRRLVNQSASWKSGILQTVGIFGNNGGANDDDDDDEKRYYNKLLTFH